MSEPLVSIVIDNFDYARFLRNAIDSALAQTYLNKEVIVVDDGSTDWSRQIIASYGNRIVPVLKSNGGQASAFNAGFAACQGELVCLLDADDMWLPEKLHEMVDLAERNPRATVLFHRCKKINADGDMLGQGSRPREIVRGNIAARLRRSGGCWPCPPTSALCFRREFLTRIMPMPEAGLRICADLYLSTLAPFLGDVAGSRRSLSLYRMHDRNAWVCGRHDPRDDLRREELLIDLVNQALARLGVGDRIRLQDQFYHRLLRYRLGEGESLAGIIRHALTWRGERFTVRMKILARNLRRITASTEAALPPRAIEWRDSSPHVVELPRR